MSGYLARSLSLTRCRRAPGRSGFTVLESTLALMLAGVFGMIVVPLLFTVAQQRRAILQEQQAVVSLSNMLDEMTTCPPERLENLADEYRTRLAAELGDELPEVQVTIEIRSDDDAARRVVGRLVWHDRHGHPTRPVTLTGWNYQRAEGRPE